MKLVRFGPRDAEKPGIMTAAGVIKDVSAHVSDYDQAFFAGGGIEKLRSLAAHAPQDAALHGVCVEEALRTDSQT